MAGVVKRNRGHFEIDVTRNNKCEHALKTVSRLLVHRGYKIIKGLKGVERIPKEKENPAFIAQHLKTNRYIIVFCDPGPGNLRVCTLREWFNHAWFTKRHQEVDKFLLISQSNTACINIRQVLFRQQVTQIELWSFDELRVNPHDHVLVPKFKVYPPEVAKKQISPFDLNHLPPMLTSDAAVRYFAFPEGTVLQEQDAARVWIVKSDTNNQS